MWWCKRKLSLLVGSGGAEVGPRHDYLGPLEKFAH
jgi:hypothetical protein